MLAEAPPPNPINVTSFNSFTTASPPRVSPSFLASRRRVMTLYRCPQVNYLPHRGCKRQILYVTLHYQRSLIFTMSLVAASTASCHAFSFVYGSVDLQTPHNNHQLQHTSNDNPCRHFS